MKFFRNITVPPLLVSPSFLFTLNTPKTLFTRNVCVKIKG